MAIPKHEVEKRLAGERGALQRLIRHMKVAGWNVVAVDDGEERVKVDGEVAALDAVFAVDESRIIFKHALAPKNCVAVVILGNSPEEVVADASMPAVDPGGWNAAMDAWNKAEDARVAA